MHPLPHAALRLTSTVHAHVEAAIVETVITPVPRLGTISCAATVVVTLGTGWCVESRAAAAVVAVPGSLAAAASPCSFFFAAVTALLPRG